MPFQPYSLYCLMTALFVLWYLYVCLQNHNTVAWFYLFLHTLLRYINNQHMSLYIFFTSLNYTLHCQMHPLSMHNLYFNLVPSHWPTETSWSLSEVKKYTEFLVRSWLYFQNWSLWIGHLPGWSSSVFRYNPVLPNRLEIDSELWNYALFTHSYVWSYWQFWEPQP